MNLFRKSEEHSSTKGSSWAKFVIEYADATFLRVAAWRVGLRSVKRSAGGCLSALPAAMYHGLLNSVHISALFHKSNECFVPL